MFCCTPWSSPGVALALGLAFALTLENPYREKGSRYVRMLLQTSVVLLGFGMDIAAVFRVGMHGLVFAALTIFATFTLGYWLARLLEINRKTSLLISAGTAICGGSAIAAVGAAVEAEPGEMSVAMGTVFLLNAVALYLFPVLGHLLGLTQDQFGTWAGVAIHDVSSVAGAGAAYGEEALRTATVVKLSRVLWIVPVTLVAASIFHGGRTQKTGKRLPLPWFIVGFPAGVPRRAAAAGDQAVGSAPGLSRQVRLRRHALLHRREPVGGSHQGGGIQAAAAGRHPVALH